MSDLLGALFVCGIVGGALAAVAFRFWDPLEISMSEQTYREPETAEEWQEAADIAQAALSIDCELRLQTGTALPLLNDQRCLELLKGAAARGIVPSQECVSRWSILILNREVS